MKKLTITLAAAGLMLVSLAGCGQTPAAPTFTVTYDGNGATSGLPPVDDTVYKAKDEVLVLSNIDLAKVEHTFVCWNTAADGTGEDYLGGQTFTIEANTTLYAQWTQKLYSVTYDANGATSGTVPSDAKTYKLNDEVTVLQNTSLTKENFKFYCWNTAADGTGDDFFPGDKFNMPSGGITLYARYIGTWAYNGKEFLNGLGADAPLESIDKWLNIEGVTINTEKIEENTVFHVTASSFDDQSNPVTSIFEEDLLKEINASRNWSKIFLDESGLTAGYLSGSFYARPNSSTNKFVVMEFQYVKEDSLASLLFGYEPILEFYFYVEQGYNAADATNLLATGVFELGATQDLIVNGASLSTINDTFIVNAELYNPLKDFVNTMAEYYFFDVGVQADVEEGSLVVYFDHYEGEDLTNASYLIALGGFTTSGTWQDVSLLVGVTAYMINVSYGNSYSGGAILVQMDNTCAIIFGLELIDPSLIKILSYTITCSSYDLTVNPAEEFSKMINTENYTLNMNYGETFGYFAFSKEVLKDDEENDQIIEVNFQDTGDGNFVISVDTNSPLMKEYPTAAISSMFEAPLTTPIPTFDFDLARVVDQSQDIEEPYVGIVAYDPVKEPTTENPSLLDQVVAEMDEKLANWDKLSQEDWEGNVTYYYTTKEQNADNLKLQIVIGEADNALVIQYKPVMGVRTWSEIADEIDSFIAMCGFENTTLPAGQNDKIWYCEFESEWDTSMTISCADDGSVFDLYAAAIMTDTENWICTLDEDNTIIADSVEVTANNEMLKAYISNDGETTTIYVVLIALPVEIPVDDINALTTKFGFGNIVPDFVKEYVMESGYFDFYDYGDEGAFIYVFIVESSDPYNALVTYFTEDGSYEIDDSSIDFGEIYFYKEVGDYYINIRVSDWMDGETCEFSISIGLITEE